jgi:hypothetical protein
VCDQQRHQADSEGGRHVFLALATQNLAALFVAASEELLIRVLDDAGKVTEGAFLRSRRVQ